MISLRGNRALLNEWQSDNDWNEREGRVWRSALGMLAAVVVFSLLTACKSVGPTTALAEKADAGIPSTHPVTWEGADYNVKVYGAIGNGSVDDRLAIQAALNAAHRAGGGTVRLPAGVYAISRNVDTNVGLLVYDNTTLAGDGMAATFVLCTDENTSPGVLIQSSSAYRGAPMKVRNAGNKNIVVRDLTLRFLSRVETKGIGISFCGVNSGAITRVRVDNVGGYSIYLARNNDTIFPLAEGRITERVTVSDCHITRFLDAGIELSGAVNCEIRNCTVSGEGTLNGMGVGAAIYVSNGSADNRISDITIHGVGVSNKLIAVRIDGYVERNPRVRPTNGNTMTNIQAYNVHGGFSCTSRVFGNSLTNSRFYGLGRTSSYGIKAINLIDSTFTGCVFANFDYTLIISSPVHTDNQLACMGLTITDCNFHTFFGGTGAEIYGVTRLNFSRNRIVNSYAYGVGFFGCREVIANDNQGTNLGIAGNASLLLFDDCAGSSLRASRQITASRNSIEDDRETKFSVVCVEIGGRTNYVTALGNDASGGKTGAHPVVVTSAACKNYDFGDDWPLR